MGAHLTVDNVGWTYIGITIGWSTILYTAFGFLWYHRRLPQIQMRRLPLVFIAMTTLHIYWILCMIGYVIGPVAPCAAEYWIMSILVPFGIAIFQVANTQFLHIASQQRRYASFSSLDSLAWERRVSVLDGQTGSLWRRMSKRLKDLDQITKMVIYVGIGMTIQAILTILIFLLSRKFHPSFGVIPANLVGTVGEQRVQCSRGWEWWLSIVWQFFWAWIYAPYVLWKSRDIQDTHGWRIQTILCCIAGLPCSPLWLCGLYLPQFAPVNAIFVPPNWFSVSIFLIQSFTVFIPCYQIIRDHHLRTKTLATIANWEAKNQLLKSGVVDSDTTRVGSFADFSYRTSNDTEKGFRFNSPDRNSVSSSRKNYLYTMVALECALAWNPNPLQKFAAFKDFSGENISFLTHLASWKKTLWPHGQGTQGSSSPITQEQDQNHQEEATKGDSLREAYNRAISLYAVFISQDHAEFPINISHRTLRQLDTLFARPATLLFGDSSSQSTANSVTPFACECNNSITVTKFVEVQNSSVSCGTATEADAGAGVLCLNGIYYWGEIPPSFTLDCFDDAEREIKYLVLTNTWPKFVNAGCAEQVRDSQGRTLGRRLTQYFFSEGGCVR